MCCSWSIYWVKTILDPTSIPLHLEFLWDTSNKTVALPEDKTIRVEAWAKDLMALNKTTQGNLECFMGTLVSTVPAVWQGPLHYRNLQCTLLISLKQGRNPSRSVRISHPCVERELDWWASGGMRANRVSPWCSPTPTLQIWTDASLYGGGPKTDHGSCIQYAWSELEKGKHINWLELRAAQYALLELASPGEVVQFHIDNIKAIAFIRRLGEPAP